MTHGKYISKCRQAAATLASAWNALCCLSASNPWLWLVRPPVFEAAPAIGMVLLDVLSEFLVAFGEGGLGHG